MARADWISMARGQGLGLGISRGPNLKAAGSVSQGLPGTCPKG